MGPNGLLRAMLALALWMAAAPAAAPASWSEAAHRAVARVAHERLSPQAERRHRFLMGVGASVEDVAGWANQLTEERPEIESWRSITIPPVATELDMARDCPIGDCSAAKVREYLGIVRLAFKDKSELRESFKFLVTLGTEMHHPLNAGYPPGSGGDVVRVVVDNRNLTLDDFWSSQVLGTDDPDLLADRIRELITPERAREWSRGGIRDWVWDTHLTAVRVAYGSLPEGDIKQLDEQYLGHARASAELQLAKAAVRLAVLLNDAWLQ